ncbi:MAG: thiamine diphosphokinase [Bacilli bacterium]|nr:thiamine diphosphokinase [Bacilli bacterium]
MRKALIVIGKNVSHDLAVRRSEGTFVIGADQGAAFCLNEGIPMDLAVGDFDSVSEASHQEILRAAKEVVTLPHHKDVTDTEQALTLCQDYEAVTILGGIAGDRIEHFIAILCLLRRRPNTLFLEDDDAFCVALQNQSIVLLQEDFEYVSIFAMEKAVVSLEGFEYPLDHHSLLPGDPLGVSNEIVDKEGIVRVEEGILLLICHKKKSDSILNHSDLLSTIFSVR